MTVVLVAVVEEKERSCANIVEEDKDNNKILVVTRRGTRLMLGVDCVQLPPLVDSGGRDWLLQEAGGLRGLPAEEGFQH